MKPWMIVVFLGVSFATQDLPFVIPGLTPNHYAPGDNIIVKTCGIIKPDRHKHYSSTGWDHWCNSEPLSVKLSSLHELASGYNPRVIPSNYTIPNTSSEQISCEQTYNEGEIDLLYDLIVSDSRSIWTVAGKLAKNAVLFVDKSGRQIYDYSDGVPIGFESNNSSLLEINTGIEFTIYYHQKATEKLYVTEVMARPYERKPLLPDVSYQLKTKVKWSAEKPQIETVKKIQGIYDEEYWIVLLIVDIFIWFVAGWAVIKMLLREDPFRIVSQSQSAHLDTEGHISNSLPIKRASPHLFVPPESNYLKSAITFVTSVGLSILVQAIQLYSMGAIANYSSISNFVIDVIGVTSLSLHILTGYISGRIWSLVYRCSEDVMFTHEKTNSLRSAIEYSMISLIVNLFLFGTLEVFSFVEFQEKLSISSVILNTIYFYSVTAGLNCIGMILGIRKDAYTSRRSRTGTSSTYGNSTVLICCILMSVSILRPLSSIYMEVWKPNFYLNIPKIVYLTLMTCMIIFSWNVIPTLKTIMMGNHRYWWTIHIFCSVCCIIPISVLVAYHGIKIANISGASSEMLLLYSWYALNFVAIATCVIAAIGFASCIFAVTYIHMSVHRSSEI